MLLWLGLAGAILWLDELHDDNARHDTGQLARALALQTGQLFQSIEMVLAMLAERLADVELTPATVQKELDTMLDHLPPYLNFAVFDAEGQGVAATVKGFVSGQSYADREYFRFHRAQTTEGVHVGEPIIERVSKAPIVPLSRRLDDEQGRFRGVLLASIYAERLAQNFALFPLGTDGVIVLLRTAPLHIVARHPDNRQWFARRVEEVPLFAAIGRGEPAGSVEATSADGIVRLASWTKIDGYPLVLLAGIARADLHRAKRTERIALIAGGIALTLLAITVAVAQIRRQQATAAIIASQQELLETRQRDARAQAELADHLNRAQRVARIGSWRIDPATGELAWSAETYRIFGLDEGKRVTHEDFLACIHEEDRARVDAAWQAALAGAPYDITHRIVSGGEIKWVRELAELSFDAQHRLIAGIGTVQDVTQQIETEEALRQARREAEAANRAKSEFLANMSHEIRTPMNAVLGLTQLVLAGPLTDEQRLYLDQVLRSGKALLAILDDILDYSKIEAGRLAIEHIPFSPRQIIDETVSLFAARLAEKKLRLFSAVDSDVPQVVLGDSLRLQQVLSNLLGNAIKFTDAGSISLLLRAEACNEESALRLHFTVQDTGIGLDKETAQRLFAPFTQADGGITRRFGGTGLGLVICKRLVEAMGGEITASGSPGTGATFSFTIVVGRAADQASPAPIAHGDPPKSEPLARRFHGGHVLVVEDNLVNQEVITKLLLRLGLEVSLADNGEQAIALARTQRFDLVLMDIHMPGIDGLEATRRIHALPQCHDLPVVALTAAVMDADRARCHEAGMVGFLAKPIDSEQLIAVLVRHLPAIAALAALDVGAAAALLETLRRYFILHELLPDDLRSTLRQTVEQMPPGSSWHELWRQIEAFDHEGALATSEAILRESVAHGD